MSVPVAIGHTVFADHENSLTPYLQIVEEFNNEYGTSYQLATPDQLAAIEESTDEMLDFLNDMTESEFYDYLYDAYIIDSSEEIVYE